MGVKFQEKNTGFIVEFEYAVDIETTRTHPDYIELIDSNKTKEEEVLVITPAVVKRKPKE